MVRYADFTGKAATNKTLLAVFRATFNGERVDEEVTIIQIDKDVMGRHSPRWQATFNQEDPLPETKPMARDSRSSHSIFFTRDITIQDLFDISIIAEKQALWKGIINDAEKWLIWCAFGDFTSNTKNVFLENPLQWLTIFNIVIQPAIGQADAASLDWIPKDPRGFATGDPDSEDRNEDRRLRILSDYLKYCRRSETARHLRRAQDFEAHLLSRWEPCQGHDWSDLYNHDSEKCKEKLLRSLQRTCTALDNDIEVASRRYESSPNALLDELEAAASGLDHLDNLSKVMCNNLKTLVQLEKSGVNYWKMETLPAILYMVRTAHLTTGLTLEKMKRIENMGLKMLRVK
ncbi:hypothetical protein F5X68DRAFT_193599 [Plectosphaerella plurivora]|uniref:Uncharacterized protein n=1 Tax=Plectosphaerella plurivora TaxID=936078 RepID=A0A9P8V5I7_9PEZI|nr:hypothetical protein F5X68DRAFT_193599 [Plectosphaerella plurivora]